MGLSNAHVGGWLLSALVPSAPARSDPPLAELVLVNGEIFPGIAARPYVEAIAIHGDRILATGTSSTVEAFSGPSTRRVDLGGRTVITGIDDAHQHIGVRPTDTVNVSTDGPANFWPVLSEAIRVIVSKAIRSLA